MRKNFYTEKCPVCETEFAGDALSKANVELARLGDTEGMAKAMFHHEHEKIGGAWEQESEDMKSYWRECALAVQRWVKGESG